MVQGIDQLKRRLVDVVPKNLRIALESAMIESADRIVAGAKIRVPVDEGDLRDSIHRTDVREGKKGNLYIAITAGERTPNGYNTARIVEFGTVDTDPQPFLLPSYRANRKSAQRRMRKAMKDALVKEHG
jgi:HK97 gp10 family phage protein